MEEKEKLENLEKINKRMREVANSMLGEVKVMIENIEEAKKGVMNLKDKKQKQIEIKEMNEYLKDEIEIWRIKLMVDTEDEELNSFFANLFRLVEKSMKPIEVTNAKS